jgi:hypothetical protein
LDFFRADMVNVMQPTVLFTKLMMLTTSTNDHEALTALRKANAILAGDRISWAELLEGLSKPKRTAEASVRRNRKKAKASRSPPPRREPEPDRWQRYDNAQEINLMFACVYHNGVGGTFAAFIESIHAFWTQHGFLTEKQFAALRQAAERASNERRQRA